MRTDFSFVALCFGVALGVSACADTGTGEDASSSDLSHSRDLSRPSTRPDLTAPPASDDGGTSDAATEDSAAGLDFATAVDATLLDAALIDASMPDLAVSVDLAKAQDQGAALADMVKVKDLSNALDMSSLADLVVLSTDLATASNDLTAPVLDLALQGDLAGGCHLVINELQTGDAFASDDEWVELYNPCAFALDLTGFKLVYRSAGNNGGRADTSLASNLVGQVAAGHYHVFCSRTGFPGNCDDTMTNSLASAGGAVGLRDANSKLVDSVAYDVLTAGVANDFTENMPAPNPPVDPLPGNSISRFPNGVDTNNNKSDFRVSTRPTPGALNQ